MKIRDLTQDQLLSVPCPTCEAGIDQPCVLSTGTSRNDPHRDRRLIAAEAVERFSTFSSQSWRRKLYHARNLPESRSYCCQPTSPRSRRIAGNSPPPHALE